MGERVWVWVWVWVWVKGFEGVTESVGNNNDPWQFSLTKVDLSKRRRTSCWIRRVRRMVGDRSCLLNLHGKWEGSCVSSDPIIRNWTTERPEFNYANVTERGREFASEDKRNLISKQ
ncbi:hypothetical protein HZH66_010769 [Vespula vulgaris]|uniref:Uncharacterized protein n=1 Tax=Vespula vulgaris TaxID=7454 RepID=A0A834JIW9_VESVU|nr:hypothetical protein HZH66_010769 [Vespula vulgaris]